MLAGDGNFDPSKGRVDDRTASHIAQDEQQTQGRWTFHGREPGPTPPALQRFNKVR
jgi:hypothetical protein